MYPIERAAREQELRAGMTMTRPSEGTRPLALHSARACLRGRLPERRMASLRCVALRCGLRSHPAIGLTAGALHSRLAPCADVLRDCGVLNDDEPPPPPPWQPRATRGD